MASRTNPIDQTRLHRFIAATPKAELHLHIEGTLEPEMMIRLAQRNNVVLPYAGRTRRVPLRVTPGISRPVLHRNVRASHPGGFFQSRVCLPGEGRGAKCNARGDFLQPARAHGSWDTVRHRAVWPDRRPRQGASGFWHHIKAHHVLPRHLPEEQAFDTLRQACRCKEHIFAMDWIRPRTGTRRRSLPESLLRRAGKGSYPLRMRARKGRWAVFVRRSISQVCSVLITAIARWRIGP
jgi:hypothetical protein